MKMTKNLKACSMKKHDLSHVNNIIIIAVNDSPSLHSI